MPPEFGRNRDGERFIFSGMKLNALPDALAPGKYPLAINIRATDDDAIQARPGQVLSFTTDGLLLTDIRTYSALMTDDKPRILARNLQDEIWLDTGIQVGALTPGALGGAPGFRPGASLIPFRPNASPTPWMYIANGADYQKFSAPDASNAVIQQKVGIAEPQSPPDACIFQTVLGTIATASPSWVQAGSAGASSGGNRVVDTAGVVFPDPIPTTVVLYNIQTSAGVQYQRGMPIAVGGNAGIVTDVFAPLVTALAIQSIYYFSGATGRCVIVPANLNTGPGNLDTSLYGENSVSSLRRGAIIQVGMELCVVWSVSVGQEGAVSIETSTTTTHTTSDTLTSVASIQTEGLVATAGAVIEADDVTYQVTAGIGTQTASVSLNPFVASGASFQPDDIITLGILVDTLANLNEVKLLLDVGDGSFTGNFYYYTIRPSDITAAVANTLTQLAASQLVTQRAVIDEEDAAADGNQLQTTSSSQATPGDSQWSQIQFPISELTRVGGDDTLSLQNVNSVQILWNANGTINVATAAIEIYGGYQADVGTIGAPYLYRVRPRSSITGVRGNPSPATRYGVSARRNNIVVTLPSAAYDPQIDTWDIFRYGGSVTSWRFIGQTSSTNSTFIDNYSDDVANAGDALDFDNFEPWPTIDLQNNGTAVLVNGTVALISENTSALNSDPTRYLPGTLIQLGGINVYTLWTRPIALGANLFLLQLVENAGASTNIPYSIQEPILANQPLAYMWGPDATGTIFACGDPLRPGTIYFAKGNNPDSAPDAFNIEITPPPEPLMGGETLDGLSFVASTERWWALYPSQLWTNQPGTRTQQYNVIQQPIPRGLAAPFGHHTDGKSIFFWAKDGIWSSTQGSLTDADLYNLFPHDGIPGVLVTYNGTTITPPDYSRAGTFRLEYSAGYLYATYQDSTGTYHTLLLDIRRGAWSLDNYTPAVSTFCHPDQQSGTVLSSTTFTFYPQLLMGTVDGRVGVQTPLSNDLAGTIACVLATREDAGGDLRAPKQWGDYFVDAVPAAKQTPLTSIAITEGLSATLPFVFAVNPARTRTPVGLVAGLFAPPLIVKDFLGIFFQWSDDFTTQTVPTVLYIWQTSFTIQPARTITWGTFGTAFGLDGYKHIREIAVAWVSITPITLTVTSFDGQSPTPLIIPSSGGAYQKAMFPLSANKGQLYMFQASSTNPFQLFLDDFETHVGPWKRNGPYASIPGFGGRVLDVGAI